MAKEAKKDNKNLIIGICAGIAILVVVIITVVLVTRGGSQLNDSYFVSDDTKYVLTLDNSSIDADEEEYPPVKTHIVYNYVDNEITGMTTYAEYADEATAKAAYEVYKNEDQEDIKSISVNGKYLVVEMKEDSYADLTAADVKSQIEFMEMFKNMGGDSEDEGYVELDDIVEEDEE